MLKFGTLVDGMNTWRCLFYFSKNPFEPLGLFYGIN